MAKGLFIGLGTVDIVSQVRQHPGPNQKLRADRQLLLAGGPAANAAVAYAALGGESHLCTGLGTHPVAQFAADDLEHHGVTLHECGREGCHLPVISSILVNTESGERCIVYSGTENRRLVEDDRYESLLEGASVLLLDGFYLETALPAARAAKQLGIAVLLDGGSWKTGLEQLLPMVDYAVCSEDFLAPNCSGSDDTFAYLHGKGVDYCAVSRGGAPLAVSISGKQELLAVPSVPVVDTLGAGDILHGALCYYLHSGSFRESLQLAAAVASDSCRYPGTRQWINHLKTSYMSSSDNTAGSRGDS